MVQQTLIIENGWTNECTICGKVFYKQSMRAADKLFDLHMKTNHKGAKVDTNEGRDMIDNATQKEIKKDNRQTRRYKMFK